MVEPIVDPSISREITPAKIEKNAIKLQRRVENILSTIEERISYHEKQGTNAKTLYQWIRGIELAFGIIEKSFHSSSFTYKVMNTLIPLIKDLKSTNISLIESISKEKTIKKEDLQEIIEILEGN